MVQYINLMLQASKHIGEVRELSMTEACTYLPDRIQLIGIAEGGEKFTLTLEVGDPKRDA